MWRLHGDIEWRGTRMLSANSVPILLDHTSVIVCGMEVNREGLESYICGNWFMHVEHLGLESSDEVGSFYFKS